MHLGSMAGTTDPGGTATTEDIKQYTSETIREGQSTVFYWLCQR